MNFYHEGNLSVLANMARARDVKEKRGASPLRCAWGVLSGGMTCIGGAGLAVSLEKNQLVKGLDVAVGVSAGSCVAAYTVAGQAEVGATIFSEECLSEDFISWERRRKGGSVFNLPYLMDVFRGAVGDKKLNVENIVHSKTDLLIGATHWETGESRLFNAKEELHDVVHGIHASVCLPGWCKDDVRISGEKFVDGACSSALPINRVVRRYCPTDILVFANRPKGWKPLWLQRIVLEEFFMWKEEFPAPLRKAIREREYVLEQRLNFLLNRCGARALIIYPEKEAGTFCRNRKILTELREDATEYMDTLTKGVLGA